MLKQSGEVEGAKSGAFHLVVSGVDHEIACSSEVGFFQVTAAEDYLIEAAVAEVGSFKVCAGEIAASEGAV